MRNTEYFKNKKITIVGLARSGLACARLLSRLGAQIYVTDNKDDDATRAHAASLTPNISVELGRHSPMFIKGKDLVVVSPGVPDTALPLVYAGLEGIPVISEIEVAWILCPATVVAVTGTNGKTTVTTLIGMILKEKGHRVFVCGNIGNPFCQEVELMQPGDFVSLEVSSFQLERIQTFQPKISVILNVSPNHLDRYKGLEEYAAAKKRIFMNQESCDYVVLNHNDAIVSALEREAKANVVYFYQRKGMNPNQSAVIAVGGLLGVRDDLMQKVFKSFKGIEHRLEYVALINGIKFINDSKATTLDAAAWALKNILEPVVLIAGGREKGTDFTLIRDLARRKVKEVVLIGEARHKIRDALGDLFPVEEASTLEEAVQKAFSKAASGDCVLLSPMCKSFDMFTDYEERGRVFKKAVLALSLSK